MKALLYAISFLLLISVVYAVQLSIGDSYSEVVSGSNVDLKLVGINTQDNPGATFLNVNGRVYMIENGSSQKIGDVRELEKE